ncbi:MAG: hypothetical protein R3253_12230, partial [Longimicrobiales bacterium]|nr:hypothetical protein [Longimicrobiales bacterium]
CKTRSLTLEIGEAASRIHELVGAVKGYTHMDQARTPQPVDVGRGLTNTLTILEGKARARGVSVQLHLAPDLVRMEQARDFLPEGGALRRYTRRRTRGGSSAALPWPRWKRGRPSSTGTWRSSAPP